MPEIQALDQVANRLPFDVWYLPGKQLDNPCAEFATTTNDQRRTFCETYPLRLDASTDDTPFFFHSFKWKYILKDPNLNPGGLAMGQFVLLLILVLSVAFSVVLIIFPLVRFQKAGLQTRWKWNYIVYFTSLGFGFIFIEISYIQRFVLFLGYPTYSLTVVLLSLLTFSGLGSYLGGKLPLSPKALLVTAIIFLSAVALGYMKALPPIFNHFLAAPQQLRVVISFILLFPLGVLLGMFFPTGIKMVSGDDKRFVPWAWGVNGCASVIGTMLSIIIAMSYGFSTVTLLAAIVYVVGVLAMVRVRAPN